MDILQAAGGKVQRLEGFRDSLIEYSSYYGRLKEPLNMRVGQRLRDMPDRNAEEALNLPAWKKMRQCL